MKLSERITKFVETKPTRFEEIAVKVFASLTAVAGLTVLVLIIIHLFIGDLF